jgi:hypothetical protein
VLQAVSDWEVASAEISTLEVPEEPPVEPVPKPTKPTEADKAIAQQENEERLLKMAESGVEKAAAEVIETCPWAVTLTKREMSRRNFSQSLLTLDVDAPEPEKAEKAENEKAEKAEETKKEQKLDKKEGEKTEGTPQSTTATEEVKEINESTAEDADAQAEQAEAQDAPAEAPADVVVTQAPMDDEDEAVEYEVPLKGLGAPAVRGVPLKHITLLGTHGSFMHFHAFSRIFMREVLGANVSVTFCNRIKSIPEDPTSLRWMVDARHVAFER